MGLCVSLICPKEARGQCNAQPGDGVTEMGTTLTVCCCRLRPRAVGILHGEGEEGGGGEGQHSSAPGPGTKGVEAKGPGDPTPRLVWTQWEEVQAQLLGEVALVQAYELEAAKLDFGAALRRAGEEAGVAESELVWAQQQLERGADLGVKARAACPPRGPTRNRPAPIGTCSLMRWRGGSSSNWCVGPTRRMSCPGSP